MKNNLNCFSFTNAIVIFKKYICFVDSFTDINECDVRFPCQNNGTCVNSKGSYYCDCNEGWQGHDCEIGKFCFCTKANSAPFELRIISFLQHQFFSPFGRSGRVRFISMFKQRNMYKYPRILRLQLFQRVEKQRLQGRSEQDSIISSSPKNIQFIRK